MINEKVEHWQKVYNTKQPHEVSWTQDVPHTSLAFINSFGVNKNAAIIDIGGGDSKLADHLLDAGFTDITVLDISEHALERAKKRLGEKAQLVKWIVADITCFVPDRTYDIWHDRATFHFLTTEEQVATYLSIARKTVLGYLVIGTFSEQGPEKCSGLHVKQYNEASLAEQLRKGFEKITCITEDHKTPFNTIQNFLFCSFKKAA